MIYDAAADMVAEAERFSMGGDLWELFFALAVILDENPVCRIYERRPFQGDLFTMLAADLWNMHRRVQALKDLVAWDSVFEPLRTLVDFSPRNGESHLRQKHSLDDVLLLASRFAAAGSQSEMVSALGAFCEKRGAGKFALEAAFTWDSGSKSLVPIDDTDPQTLASLIGYESQKTELLANTESFLRGNQSNNVLLFGDSGTGKSSSVRALLNEPDFVRRGLRMIELRHDQFEEIPDIMRVIRERNYRFILFMDDLSFEEFEVRYKHLKALIEGGLERKPDNAVVYATSNRRKIIREVWQDRAASSDDVHGRDTMQEKQSLADRFGMMIWYPSVSKDEYLSIVRAIAEETGLSFEDSEMNKLAMRWELERGFTGRAARQFVYHMLQRRTG
ncbi:MAG: ATP-binding protein [Synergistaceae bacterium]|nr:ATP-binding protein [Synergistaceae bacterium]